MEDALEGADIPVGSPTTVSRKLLQPVLLDTIRSLRSGSALATGRQRALASAGGTMATPGLACSQGMQTPALKTGAAAGPGGQGLVGSTKPGREMEAGKRENDALAAAEGLAAAESEANEQAAMPEQGR